MNQLYGLNNLKLNLFGLVLTAIIVITAILFTACEVTTTDNGGEPIDAEVPDAPTGISLTPGNGSVTVSWKAPINDGGAAISDYTVYWDTSADVSKDSTNKKSVGGTGTTLTIDGLTNGLTYYFVVTATNSAGESTESGVVNTIPTNFPDSPTGITLTAKHESVIVTWNAPNNDGGAAITDYTVYWDTGTDVSKASTNKKSVGGTDTTLTVDNLTNDTTYYFVVTATNMTGESSESTIASATPNSTVSDAPTGLTATPEGSSGDSSGSVKVTWDPPANNGGSPITQYTVYINYIADKLNDESSTRIETTSETTLTISGLSNGIVFYFAVTATNSSGESSLSAVVYSLTEEFFIGGKGPAGGIVFYKNLDNVAGLQYLEAANTDIRAKWGPQNRLIRTSPGLGQGKANTDTIIRVLTEISYADEYAAKLCREYTQDNYSDWFLPSNTELEELYKQRSTVGNLQPNYYWSSYSVLINLAHCYDFGSDDVSPSGFLEGKGNTHYVRPIRSF